MKDYYFIHRDTGNTEPIIIEYGFIDDTPANLQFLNNNDKELAEAVIKSILEYKNIPYTPPTTINTSIPTNYTIQKGDTLYALAKKYNTTPEQLKNLNNLKTDTLSIGQILKIPNATRNTYTVQKGDTLYKIANQNNTTVQAIKELNNLNSNTLTIGQILQLPKTETIKIPTVTNYTIQKGDTLYSLAKKYNTSVENIKNLNKLNTNTLSIGQIVKIPNTELVEVPSQKINYIVQPGDTLYSIARENNTTVNNIKELNNLTTNLLSIGQNLLLEK